MDLHFNSAGGHRIYRAVFQPLVLSADRTTAELAGKAVPGARVSLTLLAATGEVLATTTADADAGGALVARFVERDNAVVPLRAADVPPRATWSLAEMTSGHVELVQDGGHRTIVSWSPGRMDRSVIHLPWSAPGR